MKQLSINIGGDHITSEIAAILNVAYEVKSLNETMENISKLMELILLKIGDK